MAHSRNEALQVLHFVEALTAIEQMLLEIAPPLGIEFTPDVALDDFVRDVCVCLHRGEPPPLFESESFLQRRIKRSRKLRSARDLSNRKRSSVMPIRLEISSFESSS